jgi:SAM-dependent methyltransferase
VAGVARGERGLNRRLLEAVGPGSICRSGAQLGEEQARLDMLGVVGCIAPHMPEPVRLASPLPPFGAEDLVPFLRASSYEEPWHEDRLAETVRHLPPASGADSVYVDLGTHPLLIHAFARVGGYGRVFGANWDPADSRSCRDVVVEEPAPAAERFRYRVYNVNFEWDKLPFADECADVVTCLEVIEHLTSDPMHLLIEVNRVMKPGGTLVLSTPNIVSFRSALQLARRQHPMNFPYFFPGHYTNRHNIEYTPAQVRSMLRSAGFDERTTTFDAWAHPTRIEKLRLRLAGVRGRQERGDCILSVARKAGPPVVRYDPLVYQLTEEQLRENHRTALTYRNSA